MKNLVFDTAKESHQFYSNPKGGEYTLHIFKSRFRQPFFGYFLLLLAISILSVCMFFSFIKGNEYAYIALPFVLGISWIIGYKGLAILNVAE